jgi:hypothetical protein
MVRLLDIGPYDAAHGVAVSSIALAPPFDREFMVDKILIANPSANDSWIVTVGGREIMRFYVLTVGNQQLLGNIGTSFPKVRDVFTYYKHATGDRLTIPIPRGLNLTVASLGGATANLTIGGYDLTPGSVNPTMVNHYQGNHFVLPHYAYVGTNVTAAGEAPFNTEIKPAWLGSMFTGNAFPVGWQARILAMFAEAVGVNTYSGAADHRSVTDHVGVVRNGERLFSHVLAGQTSGPAQSVITVPAGNLVTPGGIPNDGPTANTGSANRQYGGGSGVYPAFQTLSDEFENWLDPALLVQGGDNLQAYLGVTGDVTGGADYSTAVLASLVDVMQIQG